MRIAFDITQTGAEKAGCGFLASNLVYTLSNIDSQNEYLLMSSFGKDFWGGNVNKSTIGIQNPHFKQGIHHADHAAAVNFWTSPPLDIDAALGKPDIVHSNNFYCPVGLKNSKLIYTLYDLSFIDNPEWTTEANRLTCFKGVFNASIYADAIIAISKYSRDHFLKTFPHFPAEKIHVIYPASRFTQNIKVNRPVSIETTIESDQFWLCVGTLEPRKNQFGLLKAYAQHKKNTGKVFPLIHAGGPGWMMEDFKENINSLGLQNDVILLGYVDESTLLWLYQNCFALIYPSWFEGFGLPVLEAMNMGTAVITSNATSIPEIVGQAGILVDPSVNEQITNAMDELLLNSNERQKLKQAALKQSTQFSWEKNAQMTLDLYYNVINTTK